MFGLLRSFFVLIWKYKKYLSLVVFLTSLIFALRFPWNILLNKTVKNFQKNSTMSLPIEFDKIRLQVFPPGVEFENLSFEYKNTPLSFENVKISMDLIHWLGFKQAWKIQAVKGEGFAQAIFWKKKKKQEGEDTPVEVYFVKGYMSLMDLSLFNPKMSGVIQSQFEYKGHPQRIQSSEASWSIKGTNIHLSKMELQTPLGALSLPPIKWQKAEALILLKEGELNFKKINLGMHPDDFIVQIKGSGSLVYLYGNMRLNSYDLQLQMDVAQSLRISSLLDLMFVGYKTTLGDKYRYSLRMMGEGNQVPNMEKLSSF